MKKSNEEFLYKLSHINTEYNNNYNKINLYNSAKLKNKHKEKSFNVNEPNKKIKLQLKIRNVTPEHLKVPILSTKERHLKIINNQMSLIKSLPNYIMKYFNEMISNVETEDDRESKYKNDDSSFNINNNQNENQIVNLKINLNKNLNNERTKTYSKMNYIHIINKRIKIVKYNYNNFS